jgi:hypothetical protein
MGHRNGAKNRSSGKKTDFRFGFKIGKKQEKIFSGIHATCIYKSHATCIYTFFLIKTSTIRAEKRTN